MRYLLFIILLFPFVLNLYSQKFKYISVNNLELIGKACNTEAFFHRIDTLKYNNLPKEVKELSTNSAGLAISFKTNSPIIKARWEVANKRDYNNMSPIVQKGVDLYIKDNNKWIFAGVGKPIGKNSDVTVVKNMNNDSKECLLYLPLYDEVKNMEIGVTEESFIDKNYNPFKGKIIVYGSSITQGASASRPGLAYTSQLSRSSGRLFVNLGFSGSGKMEASVADMLAEIQDVDAYILDCIPNPSPEEIEERTINFVNTIRKNHPNVPIIFIQSIIRETGNFDQEVSEYVCRQNRAINLEIRKLKEAGVKDLYLIKEDNFLGTDHEGCIDGIHPNDVGFSRMIKKYKKYISRILDIKFN